MRAARRSIGGRAAPRRGFTAANGGRHAYATASVDSHVLCPFLHTGPIKKERNDKQ